MSLADATRETEEFVSKLEAALADGPDSFAIQLWRISTRNHLDDLREGRS